MEEPELEVAWRYPQVQGILKLNPPLFVYDWCHKKHVDMELSSWRDLQRWTEVGWGEFVQVSLVCGRRNERIGGENHQLQGESNDQCQDNKDAPHHEKLSGAGFAAAVTWAAMGTGFWVARWKSRDTCSAGSFCVGTVIMIFNSWCMVTGVIIGARNRVCESRLEFFLWRTISCVFSSALFLQEVAGHQSSPKIFHSSANKSDLAILVWFPTLLNSKRNPPIVHNINYHAGVLPGSHNYISNTQFCSHFFQWVAFCVLPVRLCETDRARTTGGRGTKRTRNVNHFIKFDQSTIYQSDNYDFQHNQKIRSGPGELDNQSTMTFLHLGSWSDFGVWKGPMLSFPACDKMCSNVWRESSHRCSVGCILSQSHLINNCLVDTQEAAKHSPLFWTIFWAPPTLEVSRPCFPTIIVSTCWPQQQRTTSTTVHVSSCRSPWERICPTVVMKLQKLPKRLCKTGHRMTLQNSEFKKPGVRMKSSLSK